jgi:hypothetical protein
MSADIAAKAAIGKRRTPSAKRFPFLIKQPAVRITVY